MAYQFIFLVSLSQSALYDLPILLLHPGLNEHSHDLNSRFPAIDLQSASFVVRLDLSCALSFGENSINQNRLLVGILC